MTGEDALRIRQDDLRRAARDLEPCDYFEASSPKSELCLNCLWLHDEHPQFHATEAGGA